MRLFVASHEGRLNYALAVACRNCLRAFPVLFSQRTSGEHRKIWVYSLRHLEAAIATAAAIASDEILTEELLQREVYGLQMGCAAIADEYERQSDSQGFLLVDRAKIVRAISELISVAIDIHRLNHLSVSKSSTRKIGERIYRIIELSSSFGHISEGLYVPEQVAADQSMGIDSKKAEKVSLLFGQPLSGASKKSSLIRSEVNRHFLDIPVDYLEKDSPRWVKKLVNRYESGWLKNQGPELQQTAIQELRRNPDPDAIKLLFDLHVQYRRDEDNIELPSPVDPPGNGSPEVQSSSRSESIGFGALSDHPIARDTFGFKPYVEAIARFLLDPSTGFPVTMSIEGEWGMGKSTFMKLLRDELSIPSKYNDDPMLCVWFNPWRHDSGESLWAAFAQEFVGQLARQMSWCDRFRALWKNAKSQFNLEEGELSLVWDIGKLTGLFGVALAVAALGFFALPDDHSDWGKVIGSGGLLGAIAVLVHSFFKGVSSAVQPLQQGLNGYFSARTYSQKAAFIEQFHRDFVRYVAIYGGGRKIAVFIDDLDRCDVPQSAELLQAINLMTATNEIPSSKGSGSKHPGLAFILGIDREKVAAGIALKNKDLLEFLPDAQGNNGSKGLRFGYSFIEKFIQLPFRLPRISKSGVELFLAEMALSVGELEQISVEGNVAAIRKSSDSPQSDEEDERSRIVEYSRGPQGVKELRSSAGQILPFYADSKSDELQMTQKVEEQRGKFQLETRGDSQLVQEITRTAAEFLEYHPRRLKQFVNLFRLTAFISLELGNLVTRPGAPRPRATLTQLAKLVGIAIKHPHFVDALIAKPDLLRVISPPFEPAENSEIPNDPLLSGWLAFRPQGVDADDADFSKLDLDCVASLVHPESKPETA